MAESKRQDQTGIPLALKPNVGLAVFLVILGLLLIAAYAILSDPAWRPGSPAFATTAIPEATADDTLKQLRATEDTTLTTYGWVDRDNGIVHIPIDRAMDLILQRGLPTRPQSQPQPSQWF
jgi:hypothetical protein